MAGKKKLDEGNSKNRKADLPPPIWAKSRQGCGREHEKRPKLEERPDGFVRAALFMAPR